MKTLKNIFLPLLIFSLSLNFTNAQQMFQIHQDNVKPSKVMEYEKIAKEFQDACVEHNPKATWFTATSNDYRYFYISPIENFAELDERPFADMAKAMGDDFSNLFKRFNQCYDSHGTYVIRKDSELSYMPEGMEEAPADENYRKWYYMYYAPKDGKNIREGMKAVKEMFKTKGSKEYYRVYRDGLGQMEHYYLVSVSAKNEIDSAQRSEANKELLGSFEERWKTFSKVMDYVTRMEEYSGEMRPDLNFSHKKEE